MPKLTKKLPSYRKHKASGQAVVTLGGTDHYLGPYGTAASKREYDAVISEHFAKGGVSLAADDVTVVELLAGFNRFAQEHYGQRSKATLNYRTLIARLRKAFAEQECARENILSTASLSPYIAHQTSGDPP